MPDILDRVDRSTERFVPRTQREYVVLQIAKRFNDTHRLGKYLVAAKEYPKRRLIEAARKAQLRHQLNRTPAGDLFFEVLAEFRKETDT
jgi:hypothetical protein